MRYKTEVEAIKWEGLDMLKRDDLPNWFGELFNSQILSLSMGFGKPTLLFDDCSGDGLREVIVGSYITCQKGIHNLVSQFNFESNYEKVEE